MGARKRADTAPQAEPAGREVAPDYHDDDWVEIYPQSALMTDTARALLATAEQLGYDPGQAVVSVGGGFRVPQLVAATVEYPTEATYTGHRETLTPLEALDKGASPNPPPTEATDAAT